MNTRKLATCAIIAAIYAVLTIITASLSFGNIQFRVAEALCVLPLLLPYTGWGVTAGCLLANIFSTVSPLDIVIGTLATAICCAVIAKWRKTWLAVLMPALCNGIMVGAMLAAVLTPEQFWLSFAIFGAEVAAGELAVLLVVGLPLKKLLQKDPFQKVLKLQ